MSQVEFNVRKARKGDCEEIFRLIKDLAVNEKMQNTVKTNPKILERDGFESEYPPYFCLVIDDPESSGNNSKLIAYAFYSRSYGSYDGKRFVLGDLFISAAYRSRGLGKKLLAAVCKEALKENVKVIRFNVLKTNPALEFYKQLGIKNITETGGWQYTAMKHEDLIKYAEVH